MSKYVYKKVVRCQVDLSKLEISNLNELKNKFDSLFNQNQINYFIIAPVKENNYLDYIITELPINNCQEFGTSRYLTTAEIKKYIPIFSKIYPNVQNQDLRMVEFCQNNCNQTQLYF